MYSKSYCLIAFLFAAGLALPVTAQTAPAARATNPAGYYPADGDSCPTGRARRVDSCDAGSRGGRCGHHGHSARPHSRSNRRAHSRRADYRDHHEGRHRGNRNGERIRQLRGARPAGRKLHRASHVQRVCAVRLRADSAGRGTVEEHGDQDGGRDHATGSGGDR